MDYFLRIDRYLLKWAYQKPFNNSLFIKSLIFIGDGPFWLIVLFIITLSGLILNNENLYQLSIMIMIALTLSNVVFYLLKTNVKRKRPYASSELQMILKLNIQNRDPGHGSKELESFPSGHVLWTTVCVGLICFKLGYVFLLLIGWLIPVMIFLRLHLGVHYPSDVLAGLFIGVINSIITVYISSDLIRFIDYYKHYSWFTYVYAVSALIFIIIGFKSWLKRV